MNATTAAALETALADPNAVNLAQIAESERAATIAGMTDEQLFATNRLLRAKVRKLEEDRGEFLTRAGQVRASERNNPRLWTIDMNLEVYRRGMVALDPALKAAAERRAAQHMKEYAQESVRKDIAGLAARLRRMADDVERQLANLDAGKSYVEAVLEAQRELTWGIANASFDSMVRDAVKADA